MIGYNIFYFEMEGVVVVRNVNHDDTVPPTKHRFNSHGVKFGLLI
jgi:hypothetical protein